MARQKPPISRSVTVPSSTWPNRSVACSRVSGLRASLAAADFLDVLADSHGWGDCPKAYDRNVSRLMHRPWLPLPLGEGSGRLAAAFVIARGSCRFTAPPRAEAGAAALVPHFSVARTIRFNSGTQDPQFVPHFSGSWPSRSRRAAAAPQFRLDRHVRHVEAGAHRACRATAPPPAPCARRQQQAAVAWAGSSSRSSVAIQASALVSPASRKASSRAASARRTSRMRGAGRGGGRHSAACRPPARPSRLRSSPAAHRRRLVGGGAEQQAAALAAALRVPREGHAGGERKHRHQRLQRARAVSAASVGSQAMASSDHGSSAFRIFTGRVLQLGLLRVGQ
jgi:hypothetical protein